MFLTKIKYTIRDSFRQITRQKLLSFLTIFTIAITLTIFSVASLVGLNSYNASKSIEDQLRVVAFLKQPSSPEKNMDLLNQLEKTEHVENVEYISKEEALKTLDEQMKDTEVNVTESLNGENPLPDSFRITVDQPENIEAIAKTLEGNAIVDSVKYGQDLVENMVSFNKSAAVVGSLIIEIGRASCRERV